MAGCKRVPGIVRCCCGVGCAACWFVIGIWAFFFLGTLALLFWKGRQGNVGHFDDSKHLEYAKTLAITWGIYVFITIACGINLFYRLKHPFPPEEDPNKKDQFSAIGREEGDTTLIETR